MKLRVWTVLSSLAMLAPGCSNTVEGLKKDAKENKVEEKTEKAAEVVSTAVKEAGREIKARTVALDIKATFIADKRVDASHVKVESDEDTRTVTLSGTVPTAAQVELAGSIARSKAGDYRVNNLLTVGRS